jgi:superfamily II DNA/RNA helicase
MSFEKILSHPDVLAFLKEHKMKTPTAIQSLVIPDFIKGKSVNVIAKTGSGKTLAFALPICELLKEDEANFPVTDKKSAHGKPRAVILAPTRELGLQLHKVFKSIAHHAKMRVRLLAGGEGAKTNHLLARDNIDILIATPGRLSNALKKKELNLKETKYIIMDEADQLLDLGFRRDLVNICGSTDGSLVHVGLFSATDSESLAEFCKTVLPDVEFTQYNAEEKNKLTQTVRTFNIYVTDKEKISMTEAFLKNQAKGRGIIFVNKHDTVDSLMLELTEKFPKMKFHALHGEMEARDRKKNYDTYLKQGGVLIATDIIARGMHIDDLIWVMNFDLPFEAVYYIHRCGRVGRMNAEGFAYNLVTPKDVNIITRINEAIKNQSAIRLTSFDEGKFASVKAANKPKLATKIDKKKKQLSDLKEKVFKKKRPSEQKHLKTIKTSSTPRYKRNDKETISAKKERSNRPKGKLDSKNSALRTTKKSYAKTDTRSEGRPEKKFDNKVAPRTAAKTAARPAARSTERAAPKSSARPSARPAAKTSARPSSKKPTNKR